MPAFHRSIWLGLTLFGLTLAGCSSSGGDTADEGDASGDPHALTGVWVGYEKDVSHTGGESGAATVGVEVDDSGQVVSMLAEGAWTELATPIAIDTAEDESHFRVDGANFPEPETNGAWIILLGASGTRMGVFHLNDELDTVTVRAFVLDETAKDTPPADPETTFDPSAYGGTGSGTAFDVDATAAPVANASEAAEIVLSGEGNQLVIPNATIVLGVNITASGKMDFLDATGESAFPYYAETDASTHIKAGIGTSDQGALALVVCGETSAIGVCNLAVTGIESFASLDPMSEGDGWAFAFLEIQ